MTDAGQILVFVVQVLDEPMRTVGTFIGAFALTLFVVFKFKEFIQQ